MLPRYISLLLFGCLISIGSLSAQVLDTAHFNSIHYVATPSIVPCTLENGSVTTCWRFEFRSNPVPDDGPYCPATTADTGGFGMYDGTTNPGFRVMNASLFNDMETDGFDIIDGSGNIRIQDPGSPGTPMPGASYCLDAAADDSLKTIFLIPVTPETLAVVNNIENVELIGLDLNGVPTNGAPPSVAGGGGPGPGGGGNIPSLDPCGGHHDPAGYYHWHLASNSTNELLGNLGITSPTCVDITQDTDALFGYAKDGYPIYGSREAGGALPMGLDACHGHTTATPEFPSGVYHYHAVNDTAPNLPPCLIGAAADNPFTTSFWLPTDKEKAVKPLTFMAYPNPATGNELFIEGAVNHISMYDLKGQEMEISYSMDHPTKFSIDVSDLPNGLYVVKAEQGSRTGFERVLILK